MENDWLNGVMGVAIGDALGLPVQFREREYLTTHPVKDMNTESMFNAPPGTWSDDTSMTLAILDSIISKGKIDTDDIMYRFASWIYDAKYCALNEPIDMGVTCYESIRRYHEGVHISECGKRGERANGNGSLMRTLPVCIYYAKMINANKNDTDEAVMSIHAVSALTHNHERACIACGLYFFCVKSIMYNQGTLNERLQKGIYEGFEYYKKDEELFKEAVYYGRTLDIEEFSDTESDMIKSSGYVVDSFEAAIWSLITTDSFKDCLLRAVNLGDDADTVGAIAGGLAGLYYGYGNIPEEWLSKLVKRNELENICMEAEKNI